MGLKLLCVVAHPDDECFAFGGALALAARQGVEIHVICLTDGQAASYRGDSRSPQELGRMRATEFAASCEVLGIAQHELWDYQDAQLEFADFSATARRIVAKIRDFRPQVVLTFGPDGAVNTHPDHTMVSALTSAAFHWAASPKRFPDAGPIHHAERLYLLSTNFFLEGRPAPLPAPWTVALDIRDVRHLKNEAFRQHTSQAPLMQQTKDIFERLGHTEYYVLAGAREPQPARLATSLFDGLDYTG